MKKSTVVIGVSPRPERYAYKAVMALSHAGHPVFAVGVSDGEAGGVAIQKELPANENIDTVSLYIQPERQKNYYDAILALNPKRVIFNPETENKDFAILLQKNGIEVIENCTLIMLGSGEF